MRPLHSDGIIYNKAYVEGLKQPLAAVRDVLLEQAKWEFAIAFSEILAVLDYYCKIVDEP